MHRLFFAFFPSQGAVAAATAAAAGLAPMAGHPSRRIAPERLHVTVIFVGEFESVTPELVELAASAIETVRLEPFDIAFDQIEHWADSGATVLTNSADAGRESNFVAHMTIGYHLEAPAPIAVPTISWRAAEVALVHSITGQPAYEILGRWPLQFSSNSH